jgi:general secretion pathway protein G
MATILMTGELSRISAWYKTQYMYYYQKIVCCTLTVWKLFSRVFAGECTIPQYHLEDSLRMKRRELRDFFSHPFLKLPAKLQYRGRKGFSLLELMMVIAIIGTLAAIAIPNYISYRDRADYIATIQIMRTIEKQILVFNLENGRFPDSLAEAGLDHLRDRWGNPFGYLNIETSKGHALQRKNRNLVPINKDFDLYSMGPDGKSKSPLTARVSRDDIVRANNGAFLGKASNY